MKDVRVSRGSRMWIFKNSECVCDEAARMWKSPSKSSGWLAGNVLSFSTSRHGDSTATNEGVNKNVESTYGLAVERGFLGAGTSHRIRGPYLN